MTTKNFSLEKNPAMSSMKNVGSIKRKEQNKSDKGNIGKFFKTNLNDKIMINTFTDGKKQLSDSKNKNEVTEKFSVLQTDSNIVNKRLNNKVILKKGFIY